MGSNPAKGRTQDLDSKLQETKLSSGNCHFATQLSNYLRIHLSVLPHLVHAIDETNCDTSLQRGQPDAFRAPNSPNAKAKAMTH